MEMITRRYNEALNGQNLQTPLYSYSSIDVDSAFLPKESEINLWIIFNLDSLIDFIFRYILFLNIFSILDSKENWEKKLK
jgi:hypothetical protein